MILRVVVAAPCSVLAHFMTVRLSSAAELLGEAADLIHEAADFFACRRQRGFFLGVDLCGGLLGAKLFVEFLFFATEDGVEGAGHGSFALDGGLAEEERGF